MGLTKQYLRYSPSAVFGVIGSQKSNTLESFEKKAKEIDQVKESQKLFIDIRRIQSALQKHLKRETKLNTRIIDDVYDSINSKID